MARLPLDAAESRALCGLWAHAAINGGSKPFDGDQFSTLGLDRSDLEGFTMKTTKVSLTIKIDVAECLLALAAILVILI